MEVKESSPPIKGKAAIQRAVIKYTEYYFTKEFNEQLPGFTEHMAMELQAQLSAIPEAANSLNYYHDVCRNIISYTKHINALTLRYTAEIYQVNTYILLWRAYMSESALLNRIIDVISEGDKPKVKELFLKTDLLFASPEITSNGLLSINPAKDHIRQQPGSEHEYNICYLLKMWSKRATETLQEAKTLIVTLRNLMDLEKLNLKPIKDMLKRSEGELTKDWAILPKYAALKAGDVFPGSLPDGKADEHKIYPAYKETQVSVKEVKQLILKIAGE